MTSDGPRYFTEAVTRQLGRTPIRMWHLFAVLVEEGGDARFMDRAGLAAWCNANDLPTLAREATSRTVPLGSLLVLAIRDTGPKFHVLFDPRRPSVALPDALPPSASSDECGGPIPPAGSLPSDDEPDFDAVRPRVPGRPTAGKRAAP